MLTCGDTETIPGVGETGRAAEHHGGGVLLREKGTGGKDTATAGTRGGGQSGGSF